MDRSVGMGIVLAATALLVAPTLAQQTPMSPIYPAGSVNSRQVSAPREITVPPEPIKAAVSGVERPGAEETPIATAVIPPPAPAEQPAANAEPNKQSNIHPKPESATAPKRQKRAARQSRYARHHYDPYLARWYYDGSAATVGGWGGGRFGPSPYSSTGQ
jgi:hypothetical protein